MNLLVPYLHMFTSFHIRLQFNVEAEDGSNLTLSIMSEPRCPVPFQP